MKKFIICLVSLLMLSGCGENMMNTPTKKVDTLLSKYQSLDEDVIEDLNSSIMDEDMTSDQNKKYESLMRKHYQNLIYEVKDEVIDGDEAIVTVEIEVTDYTKIMADTNTYYESHQDEFVDDDGNYDRSKFLDYQLEKLKEADDTVKYTLDIRVNKINDEWTVSNLTSTDLDKINGIYMY